MPGRPLWRVAVSGVVCVWLVLLARMLPCRPAAVYRLPFGTGSRTVVDDTPAVLAKLDMRFRVRSIPEAYNTLGYSVTWGRRQNRGTRAANIGAILDVRSRARSYHVEAEATPLHHHDHTRQGNLLL